MGDRPAIGPEIAKALAKPALREARRTLGYRLHLRPVRNLVTAGPRNRATARHRDRRRPRRPFPVGTLSVDSARAAHAWVEHAARMCLSGEVDGMVTAPVNKEAFKLAGIADTGHQEVLARLGSATNVGSILAPQRRARMLPTLVAPGEDFLVAGDARELEGFLVHRRRPASHRRSPVDMHAACFDPGRWRLNGKGAAGNTGGAIIDGRGAVSRFQL